MKITVDTEKDSKEDIRSTIKLLQKIILEEEASEAEAVKVKDAEPESASPERAENAEGLLNMIAEQKKRENKGNRDNESEEADDEVKDIPKSIKEAYELTEDMETY